MASLEFIGKRESRNMYAVSWDAEEDEA